MKTVSEKNEVIAKFDDRMEYHVPANTKYDPYWKRFSDNTKQDITAEYRLKSLKYHTSWDWLMPVVRKIKDTNPERSTEGSELWHSIRVALATVEIEAVFNSVYSFIEWYNKQVK